MLLRLSSTALSSLLICRVLSLNFTIFNGQIFTPGFVILDSPQPGTPMGGDTIEIALDITANGILPLDTAADSPSRINNITIFMYSYDTGRNFTVSNGTASTNNASLGEIKLQEPGSTVKHVVWRWPACLAGNGLPTTTDSDRGVYNVSIRQNFVLNSTKHYTIFDFPISVTNSIPPSPDRTDCDALNNRLLTPEQLVGSASSGLDGVLFAPGDSQEIEVKPNKAVEEGQGLGAAPALRTCSSGAEYVVLVTLFLACIL